MEFTQHRFRGAFALKVILTVALVALGDIMFFQKRLYGGAFGLYGLAIVAAMATARPAVIRNMRPAAALLLAALYGLAMAYSASPLAWVMFWIAAGLATLLPRTARFDDGWRWFQRLTYHGLVSLLGPIPDLTRRLAVRAKRGSTSGMLLRLLPVVILPIIGSLIFIALFAAANPVIETWFASLSGPQFDVWTFFRILLWLVLIWLAWGVMRPHTARRLLGTFDGRGELAIPGISPASVMMSLAAFNLLFAMQNAMDAAWLWGLMPLPDGMTLAAYAHRGAYPLIATAMLAALFVLVALRPGSATAAIRPVRLLVALWIGQNLFLVFNAGLRTIDYVEAYSLTVLRISALLWMGLVALGLVLVLWRMLADKSTGWLINANLAAAGLLLTAVCFIDLGAIAAQWNVRHAREVDGDGAMLDLCYLNELGGSALLSMIELEQQKLPTNFQARVRNVRLMVHSRLREDKQQGGWDWLSQLRLAQAAQRLDAEANPQASAPLYSCDGRPFPSYAEIRTDAPTLTEGADR